MFLRIVAAALASVVFAAWPAHAAPQSSSQQQVADYVRDQVLGGSYGDVNLWMTSTALDPSHVARDADPGVPDAFFPYASTWLVMIDDDPKANWEHDCRWIFVNDDLSAYAGPFSKRLYPSVLANAGSGPEIPFVCAGVTPVACVTTASSPAAPAPGGGDKSCLHAILVCGYFTDTSDDRYVRNLRDMYRKLRACGYPKNQIAVYYYDGSKALDLDGVAGSEITGAASHTNVSTDVLFQSQTLDPDEDVLLIYTTGHGSQAKGLSLGDQNKDKKRTNDEYYSTAEFAADTKNAQVCRLFVIMDQCFSGAYTPVATDGDHVNAAIYSAAKATEVSVCRWYMAFWSALNPPTTSIEAMHTSVATSMAGALKSCTGGANHCEPCANAAACGVGNTCDADNTSTPQKAVGAAGNGNAKICDCWTPPCQGATFRDTFEKYPLGVFTPNGQPNVGAWQQWDLLNNQDTRCVGPATVLPHSGLKCIGTQLGSDTVRTFAGLVAGRYEVRIWTYVPGAASPHPMLDSQWLVLFNEYNNNGPYSWATELEFDPVAAQVSCNNGDSLITGLPQWGVSVPLVFDAWKEVVIEVDLTNDIASVSYNGAQLGDPFVWSLGPFGNNNPQPAPKIAAVNLYANNTLLVPSFMYWDDLCIVAQAPAGPVLYCTPGTTTNGCNALISASANPDVGLTTPCMLVVNNVEGQKVGLVFYGISGPVAVNWNGTSFLCVKAPTQRTTSQNSGGTAGLCDGALGLDWNAYHAAHPSALGSPFSAGDKVYAQGWFRDPPASKTINLSNAIELTYQP